MHSDYGFDALAHRCSSETALLGGGWHLENAPHEVFEPNFVFVGGWIGCAGPDGLRAHADESDADVACAQRERHLQF